MNTTTSRFLFARLVGIALRHRFSRSRLATALVLAVIAVGTPLPSASAVTIDMVTVGNPNNPARFSYKNLGTVAHEFAIGKYEVTIRQYTDFLNAADPHGINPNGIYNSTMNSEAETSGIRFSSGAASSNKYSPIGSLDRPIVFVSWFNAARFANWMHNGQGFGSTETGAYTLGGSMTGWAPAVNSGAQFYVPTLNEWFKAAYYSPLLNSGSGGYYAYATQSNDAPGNTIGDAANQANYRSNGLYAVTQSEFFGGVNLLTDVGAFTNSSSYYGTFDQTGNVQEWHDGTGAASEVRGVKGGGFQHFASSVASGSPENTVPPSAEGFNGYRIGFRLASPVVSVPGGEEYVVTTASGGQINATAGSVQIGTLAGATLNTGSAGATVATLSSGTINTSGGTVSTQGGTFDGSITGSGGLAMNGSGTLVLESANTYSGGTFINSGTVEIAAGDAIGSAPIRIANNGKFRAIAGVAVTNTVVAASPAATYEHVLGASDSITNLAPITNGSAVADIVAGDSVATTFTSQFNSNGSISLEGLNGTKFLMVLNLDGYIPQDATPATYYLGWWNEAANGNAGAWVNAVEGNIGANGSLYAAGGYSIGYQAFLSTYGPWNGTTMLGAYGLDVVNQQVWAVIDHNSDFGVTNNGILMVPEPSTLVLAGLGLAGIGLRLGRRRRTLARPRAQLQVLVAAATAVAASSLSAETLFNQPNPSFTAGNLVTSSVIADDFQFASRSRLEDATIWTFEQVLWDGTLEYFLFADAGGQPSGTPLASGVGQNINKTLVETAGPNQRYRYDFDLQTPVVLPANETHWFGIHLASGFSSSGTIAWTWTSGSVGFGNVAKSSNEGTFDNWEDSGGQYAFVLRGSLVPEPGTLVLAGLGLAGIGLRLGRRRRTLAAGLGLAVAAAVLPSAASAQTAIEVTGGTAATIPGTYTSGTYPSVLVSGTGSTLTVNAPLVIDDTENLFNVLTIENNGRLIANANVTLTNSVLSNFVDATVSSGGVLELQSGTFAVGGQLSLSGAGGFVRTGGSYAVRSLTLEDGASGTYQAGDQLDAGASFGGTSVTISSGASLTLGQNLAVDYLSLSGTGSTLQRTGQTLTVPELSVSEGASLDLIAGDVVDAISVGNWDPNTSGSSTVNLVSGTTTLVATGLFLLRDGTIPQLATIPYDVDFLSIGGQTVTYRSGGGIEDTIGEFVYVNDSGTLSLQKNLTLTGVNAGLQVSGGGTIERNGFSVNAPSLYVSDGASMTLGQGYTITDGVSVNVNSGAPAATLTLTENLVLTGETAQYGRGLRLSGSGATLVRGEGITITATAADTQLEISSGASFEIRAGDDFTGAAVQATSGGQITSSSTQSVSRVWVSGEDPETTSPAVLTVNAPLTITDTAARALVVEYGGR